MCRWFSWFANPLLYTNLSSSWTGEPANALEVSVRVVVSKRSVNDCGILNTNPVDPALTISFPIVPYSDSLQNCIPVRLSSHSYPILMSLTTIPGSFGPLLYLDSTPAALFLRPALSSDEEIRVTLVYQARYQRRARLEDQRLGCPDPPVSIL
jgi:hypothetical protein